VALVPFMDFGFDPVLRRSQLRINQEELGILDQTLFGCPSLDQISFVCQNQQKISFNQNLQVLSSANWQPRASTGLELQVLVPVVNAPFRIYYAYNPVRLDQTADTPSDVTRSMFPIGAAGDYTYLQARNTFATRYQLREPRKTIRFTVGTTF
jgi:outer membrane protein insertion porin family